MKNNINFIKKNILFAFAIFVNIQTQAQSDKKVRLIIQDEIGGHTYKIDTILPPYTDTEAVLLQLGYDPESVAKSYNTNKARRISVKTTEIIDQEFWDKKKSEHEQIFKQNAAASPAIPSNIYTPNTTSTQTTKQITHNKASETPINQDEFLNIPPGAKVEHTPEGKRITSTRTEPDGTVYTETTIIGNITTKTSHNPNPNSLNWNDKIGYKDTPKPLVIGELPPIDQSNLPPPPKQTYHTLPKNTGIIQSTNNASANNPNVTVTLGELDMFDHSSIQKKYPELLNYEPLIITRFTVTPDFTQGYFRFSFETPDETEYSLNIFEVLGTQVHHESLIGKSYSKLIQSFHVYKKGTYLVVISNKNKKFTQKITIE